MRTISILMLTMLLSCAAAAQSGVTISGATEDQTGAVIADGNLTLVDMATRKARETVSDGSGSFSFNHVAPGEYILRAEAEGFKAVEKAITVGVEPLTDIKLKMKVSLSDEVTINAKQSQPISPESNANSVYLNTDVLDSLPSQSQDILPVLSNFLSAAAQGTNGPSIVVDGAESDDLSLPTAAIKRVYVNNNPYSAEFRRPGLARVEVTTRNGSRGHYDGSFSTFTRNSVFDARNAFALKKPDLSRRLFEATLSGPLPFKRTRFFFSGSRMSNNQDVVVNALTLAGPVIENVPASQHNTSLLGRVDFRPADTHTSTWLYTFDDKPERNYGVGGLKLPEQSTSKDSRRHRLQFSQSDAFSASLLNVLRFVFERGDKRTGNPTDQPAIQVKGAFTGGPSQSARSNRETRLELQDIATKVSGSHTIRIGGAVRPKYFSFSDATNFGGTFVFSSLSEFAAKRPLLFQVVQGNPTGSFSQHEAYGFFQDEVRMSPRLSLTMGLRYEWQARMNDRNNFAPRVALAFAPGNQKTVLRAGAGIFYDRFSDTAVQRAMLIDGVHTRELVISHPSFFDPLNTSDVSQTLPSIWRIAPGIESPYLFQSSASIERALWGTTQLTVEYQSLRGVHMFRSRNINAPRSEGGLRPDPDFLLVRQLESSAGMRSNALITSFQGRVIKRLKVKAQYTLSRTTGDTDSLFDLPANNYDLRAERGRSSLDKRHRFSLAGVLDLPASVRVGSFLALASGAPFDITTGFDENGDHVVNDRPLRVTRNTGQGPAFAQLDLRLSKFIQLPFFWHDQEKAEQGFRKLSLNLDVFNVLNHNNLSNVIGELSSPLFGRANASLQARTIQLSLKFSFREY